MNYFVYILYSQSRDRFYTGYTHDILQGWKNTIPVRLPQPATKIW